MKSEEIETVVIGGGQAGLAIGYYLSTRSSSRFWILDAYNRLGDSWRKRWDSLRLFTPASSNSLPGMPFPARRGYLPTKDEMADYLEAYAAYFGLPIRLGIRVTELARHGDRYLITAGEQQLRANQVVVATGAYANPRIPAFAQELDPAIVQLHSAEYRHPGQLRDGPVLVVGAGNSGAEIARELAATHPVWLAGRDTGSVPGDLESFGYKFGGQLFQIVAKLLTIDTWLGRRIIHHARGFTGGHPLVRVKPQDLRTAGVQHVPRAVGVMRGRPMLEDGRLLEVTNVVWCTGFLHDFRWIKPHVFDANGDPIHRRGVVETEPGLYFLGLPFQSSLLSGLVGGAGADAKYIAQQIARRNAWQIRRAGFSTEWTGKAGQGV